MNSIFTSKHYKPYKFTWDLIDNHRKAFDTQYNYADAQVLLQLSLMVTSSNFAEKTLETPDWLTSAPLRYNVCPSALIANNMPDSYLNKASNLVHVLYSERDNKLFIIFSGTSNGCMGFLDLEYMQTDLTDVVNYRPGIRGHRGIHVAYQSIRPQLINIFDKYINRQPQIIISGHSLGGGLSQLCALDLAFYNPIHYSFAAPLVFNPLGTDVFNKIVKTSYRVANGSDLVTLLPLPVMVNDDVFCHVGRLVYFQRNFGDYGKNHSNAYIQEYNLNAYDY